MTLRSRALRVLRGRAANNVEFSFTASTGVTVEIDRTSFGRVAAAIEDGRITLVHVPSLPDGSAVYNSDGRGGSFDLPMLTGRVREGFFIHESVHASFDLTLTTTLPVIDEEAACYIAEAIYYRRTGLDRRRYRSNAWSQAILFADTWVRDRTPNTAALSALQNAIASHSSYSSHGRTGCYLSDG